MIKTGRAFFLMISCFLLLTAGTFVYIYYFSKNLHINGCKRTIDDIENLKKLNIKECSNRSYMLNGIYVDQDTKCGKGTLLGLFTKLGIQGRDEKRILLEDAYEGITITSLPTINKKDLKLEQGINSFDCNDYKSKATNLYVCENTESGILLDKVQESIVSYSTDSRKGYLTKNSYVKKGNKIEIIIKGDSPSLDVERSKDLIQCIRSKTQY